MDNSENPQRNLTDSPRVVTESSPHAESTSRIIAESPSHVVTQSSPSHAVTQSSPPVVCDSPSGVVGDSPSLVTDSSKVGPTQTPPPKRLMVTMGKENGYDPKLIMAIKLKKNDISYKQSRLLIPSKQVVDLSFLNVTEREILKTQSMASDARKEKGLKVTFDPCKTKSEVILKKRKTKDNWDYVFIKGWNEVLKLNKLKVDDPFDLWSFRSREGSLCFGLVPMDDNDDAVPNNTGHDDADDAGNDDADDADHDDAVADDAVHEYGAKDLCQVDHDSFSLNNVVEDHYSKTIANLPNVSSFDETDEVIPFCCILGL